MRKANEQVAVTGRHRQYRGAGGRVVNGISALTVLCGLLYVSGVLERVGIHIYGGIYRSCILTFILVMVFLNYPATKGTARDKLPWYDVILILLSVVVGGYQVFFNATQLERAFLPANTLQQVLALITVLLTLECARRAVTWILSVLALLFVTYPFYGQFLPGVLHGRVYSFQRVMTMVYLDPSLGINGSLMHIAATVILAFICFGAFLQFSGAGGFFINLALALVGRFRGGPAKVAVLASSFFGTISGGGTSNVVATGVFTIPLMKSIGYQPHFAGAVEATASSGGMILPPVMGSFAFIMADYLGVPYIAVAAAAFIPAVLYYVGLLIMVDLEAAKGGLQGLGRQEIPSLRRSLAEGWFFLLPIAILLFLLIVLHYQAPTAGIFALVSIIPLSFFGKKDNHMGLGKCWRALNQGGRGILDVGVAIAAASMLVTTMQITGIGVKIAGQLVELARGNLLILMLMSAVMIIIMGMAVSPIAVYATMGLLVAPAMVAMGVLPMAAHLFVLFLATAACFTPPVCMAAFVAATIAGCDFIRTGLTATRLGLPMYVVPFIFVYSPELLMYGSVSEVVMVILTGIIGVALLSAGLQGYLLRRVGLWARLLLLAAGIAMIFPGWIVDVIGIAVGAAILLWQARRGIPTRIRAST